MNKIDLEKLAFENSNDFELGGKVREFVNTDSPIEEVDWQDKFLRLSAEFDNYRKRISKEKEDLALKTKLSMLDTILDIDNEISLASKHSNDEGIKMIVSKLGKFLTSQGIEEVQTTKYDENLHEVISIQHFEGVKSFEILDVVSKGYSYGDKIIRYPKVIISE